MTEVYEEPITEEEIDEVLHKKRDTRSVAFFYAATLSIVCGIALGASAPLGYSWSLLALTLGCAFGAFALMRREAFYILCACVCLSLALGLLRSEYAYHGVPHDLDHLVGTTVTLEGRVVLEPDMRERTTHITLAVIGNEGAENRLRVFASRFADVEYGDTVSVTGELEVPEAFETDFGRSFDYPGYLRAQGVGYTMLYPKLDVTDVLSTHAPLRELFRFKQMFSDSIELTLRAPESGLALGILLGEKHALGSELLDQFRSAGLIHIVVLSGYNIAIMIAALMALLSFASGRVRAGIAGGVIVLFVLLVGPSATVLRAALMASLVLLAGVTGRTYLILRALLITAVIMLLWNPFLIVFDPGFQLSFLATLGLIVLVPLLERYTYLLPIPSYLMGYAHATIAAYLMTLPLITYSIGSLPLLSILANVLVLPLVPIAMLLSALAGALGLLSPSLALLPGYPAQLILSWIIAVGERFGSNEAFTITVPAFSFLYVLFAYALIGVGVWYMTQRRADTEKSAMKNPSPQTPFPFA